MTSRNILLSKRKFRMESRCLNALSNCAPDGGETMVSAIILLLAVVTAALVLGVFAVALIELNEIDKVSGDSGPG